MSKKLSSMIKTGVVIPVSPRFDSEVTPSSPVSPAPPRPAPPAPRPPPKPVSEAAAQEEEFAQDEFQEEEVKEKKVEVKKVEVKEKKVFASGAPCGVCGISVCSASPEEFVALGRTWHRACFKCGGSSGSSSGCGKSLTLGNYLSIGNNPFCPECHKLITSPPPVEHNPDSAPAVAVKVTGATAQRLAAAHAPVSGGDEVGDDEW